ncbi:MAG: hypothetical protein F7B17_07950 [Desulfurococcales archaeon]|nr:hypothetical protein [Desulfurococcales archaeon]
MSYDNLEGLRAARDVFAASIAAAVIIELLLALVYFRGVSYVFSPPASLLFIPLIAIAYIVYRRLLAFTVNARRAASRLLPPGIAGAGIAFLLTLSDATRQAAPFLIAIVYLAELGVGVKLYRDLEPLSATGTKLFIGGMALFIITLPLAIFEPRAALGPLAFNAVKTLGLLILLKTSIERLGNAAKSIKATTAREREVLQGF